MTNRLKLAAVVACVSTLGACGSDGGNGDTFIASPTIREFLAEAQFSVLFTEAQIATMESVGLQINLGSNPPSIEGTFRIDPRVLQATSVAADVDFIGQINLSQNVTFFNQDSAAQAIRINVVADGLDEAAFGEIVVLSSYISGSGNMFTAFSRNEVTFDGHTFEIAQAFSGVVTDNGIENIQQLDYVVDDRGDPGNFLIPSDTAQMFIDLDGVSEKLD